MKVLVTGAGGLLGRALVERLLSRGWDELRCLVRSPSSAARVRAIAARYSSQRVEIIEGTLDNGESARRSLGDAAIIFHLAAGMNGTSAEISRDTIGASTQLLNAVAACGRRPKVVLVSSIATYGVATLQHSALVDESTDLENHPEMRDPYSRAKILQERFFRERHREDGFPLVVVRPALILGLGGIRLPTRVGLYVRGVFLSLGGGNPLPLTYVENCADALVVASDHGGERVDTFNVVDDHIPSCDEYLRQYCAEVERIRVLAVPRHVLFALSRVVGPLAGGPLPWLARYRVNTNWGGHQFSNAALKSIGWMPAVPMDEALRRTFEAMRG